MSAYLDAIKKPSTVLKQVELATISLPDCGARWRGRMTQTMLCAGTEGGKGICMGDSGGPLVCKEGNKWFQYGINSFVFKRGCASGAVPDVFANVVNLLPWIQEHTGS